MRYRKWFIILTALLALAMLAGCSGGGTDATPTADAAAAAEQAPASIGVVRATGEVVPATYTTLSFSTGGQVKSVMVEVGDTVEAGDVIAELDTADLDMAVLQAQAALTSAQADLEKTQAGPTPEQIQAAEQSLAAAQARITAAAARRDALSSQITDADIEAARQDVIRSYQDFQAADGQLNVLKDFDPALCSQYFDKDQPCPIGAWETVYNQAEAARLNYEAAQANLQDLLDGPDPDAVAVENGRIWLASAQAQAAQARLDLLNAQPFPEAVAIAEANVEKAQADLEAAQARVTQATIVAPFGGTVTQVSVNASEFIGAAQPVVQMGDLTGLRVETTDLNEVDVARVAVGDPAVVTLDALPDVSIDGQVTRIAPKASEGSGVNYTVIIELNDIPEAVRWGMTAFVEIEVE